jgi:hypothetical protein
MSTITGRFKQSPSERKRYILDLDLELDAGETIDDIEAAITSPTGSAVPVVADTITVAPGGRQATFMVSEGEDANSYLVQFLTTTSLEKILETVVQYDIAAKVTT